MLRSHLEIVRDTNPIPTSEAKYRTYASNNNLTIDQNLMDVITGKVTPQIQWPSNFNMSMQAMVREKVGKNFCMWYWIFCTSQFEFITKMCEEMKERNLSIYYV